MYGMYDSVSYSICKRTYILMFIIHTYIFFTYLYVCMYVCMCSGGWWRGEDAGLSGGGPAGSDGGGRQDLRADEVRSGLC